MEGKLTIEIIKAAIEKLQYSEPIKFVVHPMLKGTQTVIKQGCNVYYPSDIKSGDVKIITIPEIDIYKSETPDTYLTFYSTIKQ